MVKSNQLRKIVNLTISQNDFLSSHFIQSWFGYVHEWQFIIDIFNMEYYGITIIKKLAMMMKYDETEENYLYPTKEGMRWDPLLAWVDNSALGKLSYFHLDRCALLNI